MILRLTIDLEYDPHLYHGGFEDKQAVEWFFNEILSGKNRDLFLHSYEIGDTVGTVKLVKLHSSIHVQEG